MILRAVPRVGVFIFLFAHCGFAQPIQVDFENSGDSSIFTRYSPSLGLVLWNGSIGTGGSGGISASNFTEFVHPQQFDLLNITDSATVTVAFKTGTLSSTPPATQQKLASVFVTSVLAGPSSVTTDFTLNAQVTRDSYGYWLSVQPGTPLSPTQPIFPYLEVQLDSAPLSNSWYELALTATRVNSAGQTAYASHRRSLGSNGVSPGLQIGADSATIPVEYLLASQPVLYGGFSVGGSGTVAAVDEFSLDAPGLGPDTETLAVGPTFDAQLRPGNAYPLGQLNSAELYIDGGSGTQYPVLDTLIEFPLTGIPTGATITSAVLTIDPLQSASMVVQALGYAADGIPSLTDSDTNTVIGQSSGSISSASNLDITLDAGFVDSLLDSATHLGLRLRSQTAGPYTWIASMESLTGLEPTLTIEYAMPALAGDYNSDSKVDAADYVRWRNDPATFGGSPAGYNAWRTHFGQTAASAVALTESAAVPEPAALSLLLVVIAAGCGRRNPR